MTSEANGARGAEGPRSAVDGAKPLREMDGPSAMRAAVLRVLFPDGDLTSVEPEYRALVKQAAATGVLSELTLGEALGLSADPSQPHDAIMKKPARSAARMQ